MMLLTEMKDRYLVLICFFVIAINSLLVDYYIFTCFIFKLILACKFTISILVRNINLLSFGLGCIDLIKQFLLVLLNNSLTLKLFVMIDSLLLFSSTFIR